MAAYHCRLCGHSLLQTVLTLNNAPRNVQRLFRPEQLHLDRSVELIVLCCERCNLVQVDPLLEDAYYDDYMMLATHSPQVQQYQQRQSHDFVRDFNLIGKAVKEIGCGDGSYLDHLRNAGCKTSGVEPSARSREIALSRGHSVESGYVDGTRRLVDGPYDGFVTRQVLEHVPDINGFLTGIRLNLTSGAVGLVEVPSLEKALQDRRFYDFFPDHVNYFSFRTLRLALELNGFEVIEIRHDMFDEYIVAYVRSCLPLSFEYLVKTVKTLSEEVHAFIQRYRKRNQKVAIWGAGGKGLSVLAAAGISDIDLLVDADPNKLGLITPVSHLKVESPSALRHAGISAVLITAMAYRKEIVKTLVGDLDFNGDIAVLGHHIELVGNKQ